MRLADPLDQRQHRSFLDRRVGAADGIRQATHRHHKSNHYLPACTGLPVAVAAHDVVFADFVSVESIDVEFLSCERLQKRFCVWHSSYSPDPKKNDHHNTTLADHKLHFRAPPRFRADVAKVSRIGTSAARFPATAAGSRTAEVRA